MQPSARMAEAIPGAELAVLPGGAHSPQFEAPDKLYPPLLAFLKGTDVGARAGTK